MYVMLRERILLGLLEDFLTTIALDKAREGFLGMIGLGKKSELDTVFRVCAKTLAAFIKAQYVEGSKKKDKKKKKKGPSFLLYVNL